MAETVPITVCQCAPFRKLPVATLIYFNFRKIDPSAAINMESSAFPGIRSAVANSRADLMPFSGHIIMSTLGQ